MSMSARPQRRDRPENGGDAHVLEETTTGAVPFGSLVFRVAALRGQLFAERVGLPPAAFRLLQALQQDEGASQSALEASFEADGATVTRMAQHLEAGGMIRRVRDSRDRRRLRLYLTDAGRAQLDRGMAAIEEMDAVIFKGVHPRDIEAATRVMMTARANLRRLRVSPTS